MKKYISLLLVFILILNVTPVLASNNTEVVEKEHSWLLDSISENSIHQEYFPYEITDMVIPEGMEYLGYDSETGNHSFKALKDLIEVKGYMYYKKTITEDLNEEEEGDSNSIGRPGEGVGDKIEWGSFDLGKHDWVSDEYTKNYAIRIDMRKYQDEEYIIVQDIASNNLSLSSEIIVSMLHPDENNIVENLGTVHFEILDHEGSGFTIKIPVEKGILAYDIVYFMDHDGQPTSNRYKVFTINEYTEIESGGNVTGQDGPAIKPEEEPDNPNIPEETPNIPEETPSTPEEEVIVPEEPKDTPEEEHIIPDVPVIEEDSHEDDKEYYTPVEKPGNPEKDDLEEDIVQDDENTNVEDDEVILLEETEPEVKEEIIDKDVVVIEVDDNLDEEIEELLPKTGIEDSFSFIMVLGFVFLLFGVFNLKNNRR